LIRKLKRGTAIGFLLLAGAGLPLAAQNSGGTSLASELERLEKSAQTPAQKKDALVSLGLLYRLSGSREKAAQAYAGAGRSDAANIDGVSLLEAAKLYISLGEYEEAAACVNAVLSAKAMTESVLSGARLLNAELEAFKTGNTRPLAAFAADPVYAFCRSGIYYTLWRLSGASDASGADAWKTKLLAEYPQSPEALAAAAAPGVTLAVSPQWLLFSGRDALVLQSPAAAPPAVAETAPAAVAPGAAVLQTGLFGREENAKAMASRLSGAGFTPRIVLRRVNESDYWAVTVPGAPDVNRTILALKDAGFESFPVFESQE
jgi:tetratricopeptide (TPR) repeat protein